MYELLWLLSNGNSAGLQVVWSWESGVNCGWQKWKIPGPNRGHRYLFCCSFALMQKNQKIKAAKGECAPAFAEKATAGEKESAERMARYFGRCSAQFFVYGQFFSTTLIINEKVGSSCAVCFPNLRKTCAPLPTCFPSRMPRDRPASHSEK